MVQTRRARVQAARPARGRRRRRPAAAWRSPAARHPRGTAPARRADRSHGAPRPRRVGRGRATDGDDGAPERRSRHCASCSARTCSRPAPPVTCCASRRDRSTRRGSSSCSPTHARLNRRSAPRRCVRHSRSGGGRHSPTWPTTTSPRPRSAGSRSCASSRDEERIGADAELGRHADIVAELESLVAEQPLRERPRELLMQAFYCSGRQAEALEAYQDARRAFVDELGVEPGRRLQELQARILRQDATLCPGSADRDNRPAQVDDEIVKALLAGRVVPVLGLAGVGGARGAARDGVRLPERPAARPGPRLPVRRDDARARVASGTSCTIGSRRRSSPSPSTGLLASLPPLLRERGAPAPADRDDELRPRGSSGRSRRRRRSSTSSRTWRAGRTRGGSGIGRRASRRGPWRCRTRTRSSRSTSAPSSSSSAAPSTLIRSASGRASSRPRTTTSSSSDAPSSRLRCRSRSPPGCAAATSSSSATRWPTGTCGSCSTGVWGGRTVVYGSWAAQPSPSALERAFWRHYDVDVLDIEPDALVALLDARARGGGTSVNAPEIAPYRGLSSYGETPTSTHSSSSGARATSRSSSPTWSPPGSPCSTGQAASGKSSLLRAGVARSLRELPEQPLVVVFGRWGDDPSRALADDVSTAAGLTSGDGLVEAVRRAAADRDVYLILDQAEEYFLYHPQTGAFERELRRARDRRRCGSTCSSRSARTRSPSSIASRR